MADSVNSTFKTTQVYDNEIVKATDFNFAFESIIENVQLLSKMILDPTDTFVIGGLVVADSGMNVKVRPVFGVCADSAVPFGSVEDSDLISIEEDASNDRIDIIEVKGEYVDYNTEQRGFNDLDLNVVTYQDVETRKRIKPTYKVVQGTPNSGVAPDVEEGWVKLCEIHYSAGSTTIYDDDIYNITADVAGMENEDWTADTDSVYNVGYINEVNSKLRTEHNNDGTHAEGIIHRAQIDSGVSSAQVNADCLPVTSTEIMGSSSITSGESINATLIKVAVQISNLYNSYLKFGANCLKGTLKISDKDNEGVLSDPLSISLSGEGDARKVSISFNSIEVLSLGHDGSVSVNANYAATKDKNLATYGEVITAIATAENLENATSVLAVEHGGTAATTSKEAQFNLLSDMNLDETESTDDTLIACEYENPSAENGALHKKTLSNLWTYIKSKVLGITDSTLSIASENPVQNKTVTYGLSTVTASNAVGEAKTVSIPGFQLTNGATIRVMILNGHTSSTKTDAFTIKVNDNSAINVYVNKDGEPILLHGHTINSVNWFIQPYTVLELVYLQSLNHYSGGFMIIGNPVVLSGTSDNNSHSVYADGFIKQWCWSTYSNSQQNANFTVTFSDTSYNFIITCNDTGISDKGRSFGYNVKSVTTSAVTYQANFSNSGGDSKNVSNQTKVYAEGF